VESRWGIRGFSIGTAVEGELYLEVETYWSTIGGRQPLQTLLGVMSRSAGPGPARGGEKDCRGEGPERSNVPSPELPMSLISTDEFLSLLRRSMVLAEESLEPALSFLRAQHQGEIPGEATWLADQLVELELLTRWQADKLLAKRYKGFFLGRYKLLDQIGAGGMSRVFLAEHQMLHSRRALKVLPSERVQDSTYLARFQLEARAIAALDHPNIVRAYDIDSVGDVHYLVMEYVPGPDLQQLVQQQGPLDYDVAANYMAQAARGLQHAHSAGLIHRDVKPANLLIDDRQVVKVLDLGLALFQEWTEDTSLTRLHDENVLGTADYLAPEQALDSHSVDHRADLYGLGCTLYFVLTGAPPFPEGSIAQRIARHQSRLPPPIHVHRADCPAELEDICFRLMRKNPDDRYTTAADVAEALDAFVARSCQPIHVAGHGLAVGGSRDDPGRQADNPVPLSPHTADSREIGSGVFPTDPGPAPPNAIPPFSTAEPSLYPAESQERRQANAEFGVGKEPRSPERRSGGRSGRPRPDDTVSDQTAETLKGIPVIAPRPRSPHPSVAESFPRPNLPHITSSIRRRRRRGLLPPKFRARHPRLLAIAGIVALAVSLGLAVWWWVL
jgi:serine/threonine protein kinase